jgi:periplasmic divalent cation tolerance protein
MKSEIIMACTTFSSKEKALECCRTLVREQLVACTQITGPITSNFLWDGEMCEEMEWKVEMKASIEKIGEVENAVLQLHEYELPQWVTWNVSANPVYGSWVNSGN